MTLEIEVHPAQAEILRVLLFKTDARYSELNATGLSSDHFNFHVKRLLEIGLIEKTEQETYRLTVKGKEFANRFDTDTSLVEKQAKVSVKPVIVKEKDGVRKYLMQQRLKQPFFGWWGLVGGKVRWGETIPEAAARELFEETGLKGDMNSIGVFHKMDYDMQNVLLEDKYFFLVVVTNTTGELMEVFEGGKNGWFTRDEIEKLPDLFPNVPELLDLVEREEVIMVERKYNVEKY
jgi:ADP-ribose pyrophosphatase YjhB (NUDIX family)/predicted transcriptional regulator